MFPETESSACFLTGPKRHFLFTKNGAQAAATHIHACNLISKLQNDKQNDTVILPQDNQGASKLCCCFSPEAEPEFRSGRKKL